MLPEDEATRLDSRRERRRAVRRCGTEEGVEEWRDHSARQRWVDGGKADRSSGRMDGEAK